MPINGQERSAYHGVCTSTKNGLIEREAVKCCVPAGVVTSVLSALLAARVDTDLLRRAFGVVLLYIGVKETFLRKK